MEKSYWLGRRRSAVAMARIATTAKVRLIHYDLAGRYSVMAANCHPLVPSAAAEREPALLHLPVPPVAPSPAPPISDPGLSVWVRK